MYRCRTLKKAYKKWASSRQATYDLKRLNPKLDLDKIYYKSRWIKEKVNVTIDRETKKVELEQQLIVSYSLKYRDYLHSIRNRQIERAERAVCVGAKAIGKKRQNDPGRFVKVDHATSDGEATDKAVCYIDEDAFADHVETIVKRKGNTAIRLLPLKIFSISNRSNRRYHKFKENQYRNFSTSISMYP